MKFDKWTAVFSIFLVALTLFVSLDTFVISSAYQEDATEINTSLFSEEAEEAQSSESTAAAEPAEAGNAGEEAEPAEAGTAGEETSTAEPEASAASEETATAEPADYEDENIRIVMSEYNYNDTAVYVADVTLSSAEYLKTAFAQDTYGKNVKAKTSEIAAANDAILAINGDYYGAQESGYVIRNGVLYRDTPGNSEVLCIYSDGSFEVIDGDEVSAEELVEKGVWQAFSFGPGLLENGEITVGVNEEKGKAMASNPRTAIGIIDDLHYVFVVSDGRTEESDGLSLYQLGEFMQSLGVTTAYNLDGGGSSTMVFQGEVINNPTTSGNKIKERSVSDIVYIG